MKRVFAFFSLFFLLTWVQAAPLRCSPNAVTFSAGHAVLSNDNNNQPQIFLLHNVSPKNFWLSHPVEPESASAGWGSFFKQAHWSAIMINAKGFLVSCLHIKPGEVHPLNCQSLVHVCRLEGVHIPSSKAGNYWLVESQTYKQLIIELKKRGIEAAVPTQASVAR